MKPCVSACLSDTLDICGLTNMIRKPTCFKSPAGTLLDVILTASPKRVASVLNVDTAISDFHNLIAFSTKLHVPRTTRDPIWYRSYKKFDEEYFKRDIATAPYHVGEIFDDLDDKFWYSKSLIDDIINEHAPLKRKKPVARPVPFINASLRKACHKKSMARNKYFRQGRTQILWERYRKSRNHASKVKKTSMKNYFESRCNKEKVTHSSTNFWDTVKPFLTDKIKNSNDFISLRSSDKIINDPVTVCNEFNELFANVALNIGRNDNINLDEDLLSIANSYGDHPSIEAIKHHMSHVDIFDFKEVSQNEVRTLLKGLNPKKSPGYDNVPPKLLTIAAEEMSIPLTPLINGSIKTASFPDQLKLAELSPLFKNSDSLLTGNYRPVSVLTCISKVFEKVYHDQLYEYFKEILASLLTAFRKNFSTQHVLLKVIEDCKAALDRHEHIGLILMDLSKAFDCLPHQLLLSKLYFYSLSENACTLLKSYLQNRRQRVKLGSARSEWPILQKGVPQGSVLSPLLFNVFMNDLFFKLCDRCSLYNYADDNTISISHSDADELKRQLQDCSEMAIQWFESNQMQVNPSKFQLMIMYSGLKPGPIELTICNQVIQSVECVKLLGIHIDDKLSFDKHISTLCKRASQQCNALNRIAKFLSKESKECLFNAFILSNFMYGNLVWHFCSKKNVIK